MAVQGPTSGTNLLAQTPTPRYSAADWSSAAVNFDTVVGRADKTASAQLVKLANELLSFTSTGTSAPHALDAGSGTGNLTMALLSSYPSLRVSALDISSGMLAQLERRAAVLPDPPTSDQLTTHVHDMADLSSVFGPSPPAPGLSHILGTFFLQYTPQPKSVLKQAHAALRQDGVLGVGVWGVENGPVDAWTKAVREASGGEFEAGEPHEHGAWLKGEQVQEALQEVGLKDVKIETGRLDFGFQTADDVLRFWYEDGNPVSVRFWRKWAEWCKAEGKDESAVKEAHRKVLERDYQGGRGIGVEYVLGLGKK